MKMRFTNTEFHRQAKDSAILKKALKLREMAEVRPRQVVQKLTSISGILAFGVLSLVSTLILIKLGIFLSTGQQALAGLFVLLSVALISVCVFGLLLVMWSAFVSTYLQLLDSKDEAAEATDQIQILVESVSVAATSATRVAVDTHIRTGTYPVNEPLVRALRQAVSRAAPSETAQMVSAFQEAVESLPAFSREGAVMGE